MSKAGQCTYVACEHHAEHTTQSVVCLHGCTVYDVRMKHTRRVAELQFVALAMQLHAAL